MNGCRSGRRQRVVGTAVHRAGRRSSELAVVVVVVVVGQRGVPQLQRRRRRRPRRQRVAARAVQPANCRLHALPEQRRLRARSNRCASCDVILPTSRQHHMSKFSVVCRRNCSAELNQTHTLHYIAQQETRQMPR